MSSADSLHVPAEFLTLLSFLLPAQVRYRSGNPLAHIARDGYFQHEARGSP